MRRQEDITDYLIVGAGAMGMAFADVVFSERPDAQITIVDRRAKPGGHWNDAYPFVALHQPAAFYGVTSARLGAGGADLASHAQILAYYEQVMNRFLASGRVRFLPMCEHRGGGRVVSTVDDSFTVDFTVRERTVNASYMNVAVPATHGPRYEVDPEVPLVPPNGLAHIGRAWRRYVVIGAGKTGIDAILFLLDHGVEPERIHWIAPHSAWLWNRAVLQPGNAATELLREAQAIVDADSVDDFFLRLERQGSVLRIDPEELPEKWRCATVNWRELEALRRIQQVVQLGRVQRITASEIQLERGSVATDAQTLHIDCTADGLARLEAKPLFSETEITLQSLFMCQQVFSAALTAKLALLNLSDEQRNAICEVVPHPEYKEDLPTCLTASLSNVVKAHRHAPLWLRRCRLNFLSHESLGSYLRSAYVARSVVPKAQLAVKRLLDDEPCRDHATPQP
ncbi:NAD(P)/FAD-dependent oxidoreductase [Algiphilus aromaticivorans]|uniref:NAD(P)-binding protein n=1 Tax=Algiphilus aromaticivorans TaxID=382454 RepID=UPI0006944F58|nr:NAD(P)-binding protein [Algiphilus aromaticivorans]